MKKIVKYYLLVVPILPFFIPYLLINDLLEKKLLLLLTLLSLPSAHVYVLYLLRLYRIDKKQINVKKLFWCYFLITLPNVTQIIYWVKCIKREKETIKYEIYSLGFVFIFVALLFLPNFEKTSAVYQNHILIKSMNCTKNKFLDYQNKPVESLTNSSLSYTLSFFTRWGDCLSETNQEKK